MYLPQRAVVERICPHEAAAFWEEWPVCGLFFSASDLVKFLQLFLDEVRTVPCAILSPPAAYFTSTRSNLSRRMLGFDGAEPNTSKIQPVAASVPEKPTDILFLRELAFGGPVHELIYIFLSNRVNPDRTKQSYCQNCDVPSKNQEVLYEAIELYNKKQLVLQNGL
jgi:hypothetical protein